MTHSYEKHRTRMIEMNLRRTKHGLCRRGLESKEYRSWKAMWSRCTDPKHKSFGRYGERGITICDRWKSFDNFLADIGPRPGPNHSVERIDNNENYCPENCRWATWRDQARNRSSNRLLLFSGKMRTIAEISDITSIRVSILYHRIQAGWTIERATSQPSLLDAHKPSDMIGRSFTRLTVLSREPNDKFYKTRWLCLCTCGKKHVTAAAQLLNGSTKSCGCLKRERDTARIRVLNDRTSQAE